MLILRRTPEITLRIWATRSNAVRNYSKDYDSSDDKKDAEKHKLKSEKPKADKTADASKAEQHEETAAAKLNRMLASMSTDDPYSLTKNNNLSSPGSLNKKRRDALKEEVAKKNVFTAAKRVASMLGDEQQQKQTESELLARLLGHKEEDAKQVENTTTKKSTTENDMSLSELIVGMKIERNPQRQENLSRSDYVRRTLAAARNQQQDRTDTDTNRTQKQRQSRKREAESYTGSVNLYGAEPLGVFKNPNDLKNSPDMLSTWNHLQQRDLQLQVTHPPTNYFEKIALWTDQGKVWRFPINNEQDWQLEEANVDFSEHIFLEQHLETWCPKKGPIRHFMELVCVGLSKNPYITAREKKEHILWYRDYFADKREMLKEYMLQEKPKRLTKNETN